MRVRAWCVFAWLLGKACGAPLDVPFVRQQKQGCGAASIAMIMQYWANRGAHFSPGADTASLVYRALYRPDLHGSLGGDMVAYLRDHGFAAFAIEGSWTDLDVNLSRGRPLIACLSPSRKGPLHYVVVAGAEGGSVQLHDPARRTSTAVTKASFEAEWDRTGRWILIATPKEIP